MQERRQAGCDSLGTCLFSARPQRETSRATQRHGLIALLDDARKELASCAKWNVFTDNAHAVSCGQCEMIGLQQFCAAKMHIEGAGGRLHGNVRAEWRYRRIFGEAQDDALQRNFAARIVRLSLRRNALRLLLRAKCHGIKHNSREPSGNEAESNQSVHFPFPYAGKLCELSKNERAAEPGAERAFCPYTGWMGASAVAFTILDSPRSKM